MGVSMHEVKELRALNADEAGLECWIYHFLVKKFRIMSPLCTSLLISLKWGYSKSFRFLSD